MSAGLYSQTRWEVEGEEGADEEVEENGIVIRVGDGRKDVAGVGGE